MTIINQCLVSIDHFSRNLRKQYGEIIDNQEYMLIKEHILFNLFPKGLAE